jgi:iron complex transport system permease protein
MKQFLVEPRAVALEERGVFERVRMAPTVSVLTRRRWAMTLFVLSSASLLIALFSLHFGTESIGPMQAISILWQTFRAGGMAVESADPTVVILLQLRLPRVLLAFLVGGCLAAVGTALQAMLRNPLADPYVLGISSGAALGAALAILLGLEASLLAFSTLPLCAFGGGLLALAIVYRVATSSGALPVQSLLLAGVILNAIFSALIMFATSMMSPSRSFAITSWLMGTLTAPSYPALAILAMYVTGGGLMLLGQARALNVLTLGEESAKSLGVEVERVKKTIFIVSALLTGAVVSASGLIGFIGMMVPHAVRMLVGPDHRILLPASVLAGGAFLTAADAVARSVLAPSEIPVGVITALVGGPCFLYFLVYRKGGLSFSW